MVRGAWARTSGCGCVEVGRGRASGAWARTRRNVRGCGQVDADADESGVGADEWGVGADEWGGGADEWGGDTDGRTWSSRACTSWARTSEYFILD